MPSNRFRTIVQLADEDFVTGVSDPISHLGDLICQNLILTSVAGSGDLAGIVAAIFPAPVTPFAPQLERFLVPDGALRYDGLRVKTRLVMDGSAADIGAVLTLKTGHIIIKLTGLSATSAELKVYPAGDPSKNVTQVIPTLGADIDVAYSGKVGQMEVRLSWANELSILQELRQKKVGIDFPVVLERDQDEFYAELACGAVGNPPAGIFFFAVDTVTIGNA